MAVRYARRRKRLNDAALRDPAIAALSDHPGQLAAQRLKIGNLAIHLAEVFTGDGIHGLTGILAVNGEVEQRPNLLEREPEIARPPDETQSP
jgi:hypothetical protein